MKRSLKIVLWIVALLALVALFVIPAVAQEKPAQQKYARLQYDKAAEVKVLGTIEDIQDFDCPVTKGQGAHVVLRTADARILVHVAPVSYLKQYGVVLKKGEKLQVIGARMKDGEGGDTMLAREITSNEIVLGVRTPDGKPLW